MSLLSEQMPMMNGLNGPSMELPESTLTQLILARITPEQESSVAICTHEQAISYGECREMFEAVCRNLAQQQFQTGQRVGVSVRPCVKLVPLLLGLMEAGICFVPLDPNYPKARLDYIIEHAQLDSIVVDEVSERIYQSEASDGRGVRLVQVQDLFANLPYEQSKSTPAETDLDRAAYVMYTSGSTGNPKGVEVSHRALINFLLSMKQRPGMSAKDKLLSVTTLSFDISLLELFLPLVSGAQLYVATPEEAMDGEALKRIIDSRGITMMQATPSTWRILRSAHWQRSAARPFIALCGGEALPLDVAKFLLDQQAELWNMYGPTEATVWATCTQIQSIEGIRSIGTPIHNTSIAVIDDKSQAQSQGVPGELCISGLCLANGYLNDVNQTQTKFVELTLDGQQAKRYYKTGDLVTLNAEGELLIHGRIDDQVKIRGHRIELQEVEKAMLQSNLVENVAVVVYRYSDEDVRLLAYYEAPTGCPTPLFRAELKARIPDYMVPQYYIRLAKLPLTPNGKIDKVLLKSQKPPQMEADVESQLDLSKSEHYVMSVWKNLLGVGSLNPSDTFFDVGGHSLLALQFINQVKADKGVTLIMNDLVFSNITQLAQQLDRAETVQYQNVDKGLFGLFKKIVKSIRA